MKKSLENEKQSASNNEIDNFHNKFFFVSVNKTIKKNI